MGQEINGVYAQFAKITIELPRFKGLRVILLRYMKLICVGVGVFNPLRTACNWYFDQNNYFTQL